MRRTPHIISLTEIRKWADTCEQIGAAGPTVDGKGRKRLLLNGHGRWRVTTTHPDHLIRATELTEGGEKWAEIPCSGSVEDAVEAYNAL